MGSNQYHTRARSDTWQQLVSGMAADADWEKRWHAAQQRGINPQTLRQLAIDPHPVVRLSVLANPACDAQCLTNMVRVDPEALSQTLGHPACPPQLVAQAAASNDYRMRLLAAKHPRCSGDILIRLLADEREDIRQAALINPGLPESYRNLAAVSWIHPTSSPPHPGSSGSSAL